MWISTEDLLPGEEIPVIVVFRGKSVRIGERRWDNPGFEDTYKAYWYWDDPSNDGQCWDVDDITHWMPLPELPKVKSWSISKDGKEIYNNGFTHDVKLVVDGDWPNDDARLRYADKLCSMLNQAETSSSEVCLTQT